MALETKGEAALALHRFGFGPRVGSLAAIASDPRDAIVADLDRPNAAQTADTDFLTSSAASRAVFSFQQGRKTARPVAGAERAANNEVAKTDKMNSEAGGAGRSANMPAMEANPQAQEPNPGPGAPQQIYLKEAKMRLDAALGAEIGFAERLVWFWSNHFCVSADNGPVRAICGAFEREAIRSHALGKFADMLVAVESHPAMLFYLDNARSVGPNSIAGARRDRGLNENLAREILELHTLGVRTVYSQNDVTNFAKVITGWTVMGPQDSKRGGEFMFNARLHEAGAQNVIGRNYPDSGYDQGRAVLLDLARHPATARHIAVKLAQHFVADHPPSTLVAKLTKRFLDTDGNLKEVAKAMVAAPEAWTVSRTKLKRPGEWIISAMRATGLPISDVRLTMQAQELLGEPLWRPPAPNGFSDDSVAWMDGVALRLDIANQLAQRAGALADPQAIAEIALGPLLSVETRQTLANAESRPQALALLLMAPEFQRR